MFLGHPGTGFAAKRIAPQVSLGTLILAPILLDVLWPIFLFLGIERVRIDPGNTAVTPLDFYHYPWTHSLLMAAVWSVVAGAVYRVMTRDGRGAAVVGTLVLSHWFLDFIVHRPDLPLYPGGPKVGLGLWNSVPATLGVEALFFGTGVAIYTAMTRPRSRGGSIGLWSLVIVFLAIYAANLTSPPPPNVTAIAIGGLLQLVFPLWAWSFDRRRVLQ